VCIFCYIYRCHIHIIYIIFTPTDASNFYTTVYHYPAGQHENGTMRQTYSWDYGTYLGEIEEAMHTFNVVGNVNEHGLVITESTFGGLLDLACSRRTGARVCLYLSVCPSVCLSVCPCVCDD
jgi:hypothetical protein